VGDVRRVEFGQNAAHRRGISGLERGQDPLQVIRFLGFARLGHGDLSIFRGQSVEDSRVGAKRNLPRGARLLPACYDEKEVFESGQKTRVI
jgi:hypothetical protein